MGITMLILVALAASEAVTLVKVRKQSKRLAKLERNTKGSDQDAESALDGGGVTLWNKFTYFCKLNCAAF
ncbi:MAG: hypothetical protein FVQ79_10155 [Planctomycetes bacterium]|nr:hypothetical protein [Planctomycetota bacterium]